MGILLVNVKKLQNMVSTNNYLLKVENLKTYFPVKKGLRKLPIGFIKAVDGVSFSIKKGQTLGLVGESGCGKTTIARNIIGLTPAMAGCVIFDKIDIFSADENRMRHLRRSISLVFQDPFGSLNPRMTVGDIIGDPLKVHKAAVGSELSGRVAALLLKVGLSPEHINRYPHEFSGGQRQRIAVARALALQPRFIICDEPVSALDVSIRSQILNLLKDLQEEFALTYLFIAHDLAVVEFFADYVAVMYMGRIVEQAPTKQLFQNPLHPYTCALLSAIPQVGRSDSRFSILDPRFSSNIEHRASSIEGFSELGCAFGPRCPLCRHDCLMQKPTLKEIGPYKGHFVACWKY